MVMARSDTSLSAEAGVGCSNPAPHLPPVGGVINSGGVLADAIISGQSAASIRTVFAPKLVSAVAMHREAEGLPVSQLLLFSSVASLLGSPGQANYAAANAALEGWVAAVCTQGVNGLALQWGAWAAGEGGDAMPLAARRNCMASCGAASTTCSGHLDTTQAGYNTRTHARPMMPGMCGATCRHGSIRVGVAACAPRRHRSVAAQHGLGCLGCGSGWHPAACRVAGLCGSGAV